MSAKYDPANVFAKILRGEIPSHKVYEDSDCIVIMDVMPQANGHSLIVPKKPSRNLLDADPETLARSIRVIQRVARASMKAFNADGIVVRQFNEEASGQTVFHLHFHVIPIINGVPLKQHAATMEEAEILAGNAEKLAAALESEG
ncbi:HIT family protein [Oricola thermophila]|uniref:HIT family protein n=1 Tax=Oricola thermophila TaxID=2742145 RepID=A0A6N1VAW6_9HYPH|nr:HIT family protein [Oricola thermophila]QKV18096.1 HIT family protein [Oricola thermophila]